MVLVNTKICVMEKKDIASRIRIVRVGQRLSMQALSDRLNIPKRTIDNYERAITSPSYEYLLLICTTFNVNATWLLTGEGSIYENGDEGVYFKTGVASPGGDYGKSLEARVTALERQCEELKNQIKNRPPGGPESSEAGPGDAVESGITIRGPDRPFRKSE